MNDQKKAKVKKKQQKRPEDSLGRAACTSSAAVGLFLFFTPLEPTIMSVFAVS